MTHIVPPDPARLTLSQLALAPTFRAAVVRLTLRPRTDTERPHMILRPDDFRQAVCRRATGATVLFVVDSSGSMGARRRMAAVKGAVMSLLLDVYRRRDRVGLIAVAGDAARLLLAATPSVTVARDRLGELPTGGRTPFAGALTVALEVLRAEKRRSPGISPVVVLVSDGRANVPLRPGGDATRDAIAGCARLAAESARVLALDTETGPVRLGLMRQFAAAAGGRYVLLDDVRADVVTGEVRNLIRRAGGPGR